MWHDRSRDRRTPGRQSLGPGAGVGRTQRLIVLRSFAPFADLPPEELAVAAEYAQERHFPAGTPICHEGKPVTALQLVVRGEIELYRKGRHLRSVGDRAAVGGIGLFAEEPGGYDCVAAQDTTTLEISAYDIYDIFEDHFPLLRAALRGFAAEVLATRRRLGATAGFGSPARTAKQVLSRPLDRVEQIALLRRSMPFARSQLESIADLAREASEQRFEAGALLWRAGDAPTHVLIPACGIAECTSGDGSQRFELGSGDGIGSLDALAERPRWCTIRATDEIVALRVDIESLHDVFEDHFEMAMGFVRVLARTLLQLYERAAEGPGPQAAPSRGGTGPSPASG